MKKEHNTVLELVKYGNKKKDKLLEVLDDKTTNWIEVLGYLCYHRVSGLAYEIMNLIGVRKLDFPVFFTIYMIHESQGIRTNLQKEYIKTISSKLCEANIKHVFLKGSVLSSTIYPIGARASNDIDILVSKKSILETKNILNDLGFLQGKHNYKMNIIDTADQDALTKSLDTRGEMFPFVKIINERTIKTIDVDVNFSLDWTPNSLDSAVDYFLEERILVPVDGDFSIYSLKEEHLFIHLCNHLYKDAVLLDIVKKRKVLDLYKFVDIYVFIQKYFEQINVEKIYNDSVKHGFDKNVFFTLNYVSVIFPEILEISNVVLLRKKFNYVDDNVMKEIFDEYNPENKMVDKGDLIDRLFSYDIINKYN
jgi:hypothetical protein